MQKEQLGTGHAVMQASDYIEDDDLIFVINADQALISSHTIKSLTTYVEQGNYGGAVLAATVDNPGSLGRIVRDSQGNLSRIVEKKDCNEDLLYMALDQLQQLNVRMIIPTIKTYLMDPNKHFFAKTLLMEIMIDQQVDEEMEVEKFGQIYSFNPSYMPMVLDQLAYTGILKYLENALESDNPSLFEQCQEYLEYLLYSFYPQEIDEMDYNVWAASIHYYVATLLSIDVDLSELEILYYCDLEAIEEQILALKQVEC